MVNIVNWFLAIVGSSLVVVDIEKIQFVCNYCENTDIDCSVVGGKDGVMVVYVRSCQECEAKASFAPLQDTFSDAETTVVNYNAVKQGVHLTGGSLRGLLASFWLQVSSVLKHFTNPPTSK